jgi:hypothetical protein
MTVQKAESKKKLLKQTYHQQHQRFKLNDEPTLKLDAISLVPWIADAKRQDEYKKIIFTGQDDTGHKVKFIRKNAKAHGFVWKTDPKKLKEAVRWGIVKTESITGKVIATLGHYRVMAHARICKGMISNSQDAKLKLLDLYQDRFEALEALESLVNKKNDYADYQQAFKTYIDKLTQLHAGLELHFDALVRVSSGLDEEIIAQIKQDISDDIQRAKAYLDSMHDKTDLRPYQRARGHHSLLEFVKQQMHHGLYELQGINQDMTYSKKRYFALTRGQFNNLIEDARKAIDDQQADLSNAVIASHHGDYQSTSTDGLMSYDFTKESLSPAREREVLMAISFVEGWDQVENNAVKTGTAAEPLDVIHATEWKTHRNFTSWMKSIGHYLWNILRGTVVDTQPWAEETWKDANFHLKTTELWLHAKPNVPMWRKPFLFCKAVGFALKDVFTGIYDVGAQLALRMPAALFLDWDASGELPDFESTLMEAKAAFSEEEPKSEDTSHVLETTPSVETAPSAEITAKSPVGLKGEEGSLLALGQFAQVDYSLATLEQNDILTAMARGLTEFSGFFTHQIYGKDPVGGLLFTMGYLVGAGAIYLPTFTAKLFGASYVNWFTSASYTMGASPFAATLAGGSTQAQVFSSAWEAIAHGPSGMTMNALYQAGEDPLTLGAYFFTAYAIGYVLANGVAGCPIPWLSETLRADLGSAPETGYPLIGAKVAIMLYEALHKPEKEEYKKILCALTTLRAAQHKKAPERAALLVFLAEHAHELAQLPAPLRFKLARQVDSLCTKDESRSLKKWLYPEKPVSIAFQLFAIPLYYVPALLRIGFTFILSLIALNRSRPHPWAPLKRAATDLFDHVKKDLSRLFVLASYLLYMPYTWLACLFKIIVYPAMMLVGRIAGLFNLKPAHACHRFFANVHNFMRNLGEWLYPVRALKSVAIAHPVHTIREIETSYERLVKSLDVLSAAILANKFDDVVSSGDLFATANDDFDVDEGLNPTRTVNIGQSNP